MNPEAEIALGLEPEVFWTMSAGVNFIRKLQDKAFAQNFYLALAGGNLNRGYSFNDLDIVAVNNQPDSDYKALKAALEAELAAESTVKLVNNRVHLKWKDLRVEVLVIERLPRESL